MKHKIRVTLEARVDVEIEVEADMDEDPCDLTNEDRMAAIDAAQDCEPDWEVIDAVGVENSDG